MSIVRITLALIVAMLVTASGAHAQKRVALVVGNSAYEFTSKLDNPKNDAADMAQALRKHGFKVLVGLDLGKAAFDRKIRDFSAALHGAEVGLFFYAGHGLQVANQNYLVPIDAALTTADALDFEMVPIDVVYRTIERQARVNLLFLDACRNNPLANSLARTMGTRAAQIGQGLAPVEAGSNALISFSTQPGNVALDGTGRNSPFAGALVKHVSLSLDDIGALLIAVRTDVMKDTLSAQVPWEHSSLTQKFFFDIDARVANVESFKYWPAGHVKTGTTVKTVTPDGRTLTCIGGDYFGSPRRCTWK